MALQRDDPRVGLNRAVAEAIDEARGRVRPVLTRKALAERAGVSESTAKRMLGPHTRHIDMATMHRFALALDVSPDVLMRRAEELMGVVPSPRKEIAKGDAPVEP